MWIYFIYNKISWEKKKTSKSRICWFIHQFNKKKEKLKLEYCYDFPIIYCFFLKLHRSCISYETLRRSVAVCFRYMRHCIDSHHKTKRRMHYVISNSSLSMAKTNSSLYANERYLEQRFSGFSEDVASRILFVGCGWCDCDLPCTFWMSRLTGWSTFFWKW